MNFRPAAYHHKTIVKGFILLCSYQFHPKPSPRDTTRRGKTLLPGQSLCTKTLPQDKIRNSKAPPSGHKDRKFWHCLKWKALSSQRIKQFFNEETDCKNMYLGGQQTQTMFVQSFIWHESMYIIIFREEMAWNYTKNISNFIRFLLFMGPLLNTRQPQNSGRHNSQDFLDIIISTDRFYRRLCFMKIAEFPPRLLTWCFRSEYFF